MNREGGRGSREQLTEVLGVGGMLGGQGKDQPGMHSLGRTILHIPRELSSPPSTTHTHIHTAPVSRGKFQWALSIRQHEG